VEDLHIGAESGLYEFMVTETRNGGQTFAVNWEFLSSAELRELMGTGDTFKELNSGPVKIAGDSREKAFEEPQALLDELMDRAKKGLTVQRYKGLGEMNPDQLWLRVRIEDAVEADDIFTVLMGDKVEPRREFIRNNALEVRELDI